MSRVKAPGKWIDGLARDMRLSDAALAVLGIRLEAVELMLPLASGRADEDEEYIHQVRVATRRADAALLVFGELLPRKRLEKARRRLRKIRRAAGTARTCDVHLSILAADRDATTTDHEQAVLDEIINWTARERGCAQKPVIKVADRYPVEKLQRKRKRLLKRLSAAGSPSSNGSGRTFGDVAASMLPELLEVVATAAGRDLHDPEHLHDLRLCAKRLRYALELFASCCGDHFKKTYAAVQQVQGTLGDINDTHEIVARVERFGEERRDRIEREAKWPAAYESLLARYRGRLATQIADFHAEWEGGGRRAVLEELAALEITGRRGSSVGAAT
jgi:CHAD domain-containing protein